MHADSKLEHCLAEQCAFVDVAECLEQGEDSFLSARTAKLGVHSQFGMYDMVCVSKTIVNPSRAYPFVHFVAGLDTSSAASIATYINDLNGSLRECKQSWFPRMSKCKLAKVLYCCFAPISRCDVRVEVKFPGSVTAYAVNEFGQHYAVSDELWTEAHVFSIMRFFFLGKAWQEENSMHNIVRRVNPFPEGAKSEDQFLQSCTKFLAQGEFSALLFEGFASQGSLERIVRYFSALKLPELSSLEIRGLFRLNRIEEAFQRMASNVQQCATRKESSVQAFVGSSEFLLGKGDFANSVRVSEFAVKMNPTSWKCWLLFVEGLIGMQQYSKALSILNNIPMYEVLSTCDKLIVMDKAWQLKTFIPTRHSSTGVLERRPDVIEDMLNTNSSYFLSKRDKFITECYSLLCRIYHAIGWDALLRVRGEVFVMIDEPCAAERKLACEQWLDDLFLVLYEDIKIYTVWKAETCCFRDRSLEYTHNWKEWEILGTIANHLLQFDDAIYAFQSSLEQQFTLSVARHLAILLLQQSKQMNFLLLLVRIIEYQAMHYRDSRFEPEAELIRQALIKFGVSNTISTVASISNDSLVEQTFGCVVHRLDGLLCGNK